MSKNIGTLFMDLQAISIQDANRARRLLNCGCPKAKVIEICEASDELREQLICLEERKLLLLPLAPLSPFN